MQAVSLSGLSADHAKTQEKSTVYLHGKHVRPDGKSDTFWCCEVESKEAPMRHHKLGLSFTASGYGMRIPTTKMVKFNGRWRRVYFRIFSNSGTLFIGQLRATGEVITVQDYQR